MKRSNCEICHRISLIRNNKNPYFVKELKTGYVVIGDYQFYKGYTLFLCKQHAEELHELQGQFRKQFLQEMSMVAEAIFKAFRPKKLNYELLGNTDPHLHWHLFPRYKTDPEPTKAVWHIDKEIRNNEKTRPSEKELHRLKTKLFEALEEVH
ncbi:MAG: HIT family protein [bacterium]|nr:HIT family protein [bacterium]